ncbi:MAG: T9SS type A sorting domain-containing protein [Bacteroidetes bacterium]|nr:T9SS type A sorting domain-containing protein [Bacteroidota bacterium]
MRVNFQLVISCLVISLGLTAMMAIKSPINERVVNRKLSGNSKMFEPSDHFFMQRSWPSKEIDFKAYEKAILSVNTNALSRISSIPGFGGDWTLEGPSNVGGRINTILVDPTNSNIIFVGCATGGIFKSIDAGSTWSPVFDQQPFMAIGCLVFEPGNSNTIFAGTGDPNISGYPFIGDGIWKSIDGGDTWVHIGLTNQRIISKIVIDPTNSNIMYAGTMGIPFERNNERGLYKSTDGGNSWNQILFISDDSGIIDLVLDYNNPDILYAAGWNRIRNNEESVIVGQAAKIYKSTDGGTNWNILTSGLPQNDMSRIGLTMSKTNPNVIYAAYVNDQLDFDGVYKTINGGSTWTLQAGNGIDPFFMGGFGWYFGRIEVNPSNDNQIFICGVDIYRSNDGGNNWLQSDPNFETHADKHDVFFINASTILLATDGGMYRSTDGGNSWSDAEDIPNTQFYRVTSNPFVANEYSGGTQDNGTVTGNAANINGWQQIFGGDGFTIIYNPIDPLVYYVETQNGDIWATSDGGVFVDYISGTIDATDRRNWDMPYILSSHNQDVLYTGTYRIYKNNSGPVDDWQPISPDLTDGIIFAPRFHTITTLAESPLNANYLYAGTSDGNVWKTNNGGSTWDNITGTLPDRYVTSIKASSVNQDHIFVTVSGYKYNEYIPHVFKSTDNGFSWTDISGNLPQIAVNDIVVNPANENLFVVATDGGVYATINAGVDWERVGVNMPVIPVYDLDFDMVGKKIVAGTHARSLMTYPIDSLLISSSPELLNAIPFVSIGPVPANDNLIIYLDQACQFQYRIFDGKGLVVKQADRVNSKQVKIDISSFNPGVYYVEIEMKGSKFVRKFLKI